MDLSSKDTYEIRAIGIISDYDRKILTRLYQPMIGYGALSLYFTLWAELEGDKILSMKWNHDRLFNIMNISSSEFLAFRQKLEAIGLLATYCSSNEPSSEYIYQLYSPLSPEKFFKNKIYNNILLTQLGEVDYETTKFYFRKNKEIINIPEISATFNDIFKFNENTINHFDNTEIISHIDNEVKITFDIEGLMKILSEYLIPKEVLTPQLKLEIASLGTIYNLTPLEMKDLVETSYGSESKKFDKGTFSYKVLEYVRANPKELKEVNENEIFDTLTPIEFLRYKHFGKFAPNAENKKIEKLILGTGLEYPVINVIIDYVLSKNKNKLNNKFMEELAGTFIREKIKTSEDAIKYLYKDTKLKPEKVEKELTKEDEDKIAELLKELE